MGVASGWVGSSAKNETGEQWMSAAGSKLGLGRPFMMSQMVGRSLGCKIATAAYSDSMAKFWGAVGPNWPLEQKNKGTIQNPGSCGVGTLIGIQLLLITLAADAKPSLAVYLQGGRASNITVNLGGNTCTVAYQQVINGQHYYWTSNISTAFQNVMKSTGTLRDLKIS
ncbi:TPA: hypothetical protein ACIBVA_003132 [Salmonella enterica subsp. enterica serovar Chester]